MSPESQPQTVERQLNLVDSSAYSVEVIYFDNQTEHESTPQTEAVAGETFTIPANPEYLPPIDLIDFTPPDIPTVTPEPLYVWAGDAPTENTTDRVPVSASQHNTLQSDAQSWELAA